MKIYGIENKGSDAAQRKKLKWIGGWRGERGEEGGGEKKSSDDG